MRQVYKGINQYFNDNVDNRGLFFIKNSSKLVMSETNHQVFQCGDDKIFDAIFKDPNNLNSFIESKKLYFKEQLDVVKEEEEQRNLIDEMMASKPNTEHSCVSLVDNETLIKNLEKPYLFVTLKFYADTLQRKE